MKKRKVRAEKQYGADADSPEGAIEQIVMMSLLAGVNLDWASARTYAANTIDLVVQMRRSGGGRQVSEITAPLTSQAIP